MFTKSQIKNLLSKRGLSKANQLLILLAHNADQPMKLDALRDLATDVGAKKLATLNMSAHLNSATGKAIHTPSGWELTDDGKLHVSKLAVNYGIAGSAVKKVSVDLRSSIPQAAAPELRRFLEEAITCLEHRNLRAAVVLSWVGAVSVLQEYVLSQQVSAFNAEALRRDPGWKAAKTKDDFGRMRESTFLDILEHISVIGNNVKKELKNCLDLRNACGHPNSLRIGESRVAGHVEILILNVFTQFH